MWQEGAMKQLSVISYQQKLCGHIRIFGAPETDGVRKASQGMKK